MKKRWSEERVWEWYNARSWLCGCNYVPADSLNFVDFWQNLDFEAHLKTADRELAVAEEIGFNSIRVFLSFDVWEADRDGYLERFGRFLEIAASHGISVMPVMGNDCWAPREVYEKPVVGIRPEAAWGFHGGTFTTPFAGKNVVGFNPMDEPETEQKHYDFLRDFVSAFKDDERILLWDLWNEPGNSKRDTMSIPFMKRFFEIAREIDPVQPLTACVWSLDKGREPHLEDLMEIEKLALELSDVITFHFYGGFRWLVEAIAVLKSCGRPILNTEWLHRMFNNNVDPILPVFWLERIGSYNWGLFAGKSQYYEPWEALRLAPWKDRLDFRLWQHDLFKENGRPYDPKEIEIIKQFTGKTNTIGDTKK